MARNEEGNEQYVGDITDTYGDMLNARVCEVRIRYSMRLQSHMPGKMRQTAARRAHRRWQPARDAMAYYEVGLIVRLPSLLHNALRLSAITMALTLIPARERAASNERLRRCCYVKGRVTYVGHCPSDIRASYACYDRRC